MLKEEKKSSRNLQLTKGTNNMQKIKIVTDTASDITAKEAKALDTYIDFYSDHVFSFILHKYDLIMNDQRTTVKNWTFYDWNDIELRTKYEICSEFNILI